MHFGYHLRTGTKGRYKYWYLDDATNLLYEGPPPKPYVIQQYPTEIEHPPASRIEACPWEGLHSTPVRNHPEKIRTKNGVLYNLYGTTKISDIDYFETAGLMRANQEMQQMLFSKTSISVATLKRLHETTFKSLYPWAGQFRTVDISKDGAHAFRWPDWRNVEGAMGDFESKFLKVLTPGSPSSASNAPFNIATLICELLAIHPFREGNGRVARLIGDWLALQSGLPKVRYYLDDEGKERYVSAVHAGYAGDYNPLAQIVHEGIVWNKKAFERMKKLENG